MSKKFPVGVQWVAGISTKGAALGNLPDGSESWDSYLSKGNALHFDAGDGCNGDRVKLDTSPPLDLVNLVKAGQLPAPVWTITVVNEDGSDRDGFSPWTLGPAQEGEVGGDPEDQGGEGIPLSSVNNAYRQAKGFCVTLKPEGRKPGRFICKITVAVGDYEGSRFLLIPWA
jgi:hypothetical protein